MRRPFGHDIKHHSELKPLDLLYFGPSFSLPMKAISTRHDELLDAFSQWIEEYSGALATNKFRVELTPVVAQTPIPVRYADLSDSKMHQFVGRVTLWNGGECDLEASAIEDISDFVGFVEHVVVQTAADLERTLNQYIQRLKHQRNSLSSSRMGQGVVTISRSTLNQTPLHTRKDRADAEQILGRSSFSSGNYQRNTAAAEHAHAGACTSCSCRERCPLMAWMVAIRLSAARNSHPAEHGNHCAHRACLIVKKSTKQNVPYIHG